MPALPRPEQVIQTEKKAIIDAAVDLISEQGAKGFSLRALARVVGMSAANLYNYFSSKEELLIYVRMNGFTLLQKEIEAAVNRESTALGKLEAYCRQLIAFGEENAGYYQLMLNTSTPKDMDFSNTPLMDISSVEKKSSIYTFHYLREILRELGVRDEAELTLRGSQVICQLHGFVALEYSRILREIGVDLHRMREETIQDVLHKFS